MRLNQYIAHSGLCSRREADQLIKDGKVTINGLPVESIAVLIDQDDKVKVDGKLISPERNVYILLNKPKDFITTTDDEKDRKTVLDLVKPHLRNPEYKNLRIYPVGRLDRNTTGLLLLTNDGELTQELTHPKYNIEKIYIATLDKKLSTIDADKIVAGLELEDGIMTVDELAYPDPSDKSKIGIAIHSGKNRIVRRIFEHLGYEVTQLDRIVYANLTKKDLPRGKWRFLEPHEVAMLKNKGKKSPQMSIQEKNAKRTKGSNYASKNPKYNKPLNFKEREEDNVVENRFVDAEVDPSSIRSKLESPKNVTTDRYAPFDADTDFKSKDSPMSNLRGKPKNEKFTKNKKEYRVKEHVLKPGEELNPKSKALRKSLSEKPKDFKSKDGEFKPREYKGKSTTRFGAKTTEFKSKDGEFKPREYKGTKPDKFAAKNTEFKPKRKEKDEERFEKVKVKPTRVQDKKLTSFNIPRTKSFSKKTK